MSKLQEQKDELNKAVSKSEKVVHKPDVDGKYDDMDSRYERLDVNFTDKEKQVILVDSVIFHLVSFSIMKPNGLHTCNCPGSSHLWKIMQLFVDVIPPRINLSRRCI